MKKLLFINAILLSCIYSVSAGINPMGSVFTLSANEASFVIDLNAFEAGEVNYVTVADESGKIIFTDYIERNKQRIKYVLGALPADAYTVKLKGDYFVANYKINIVQGKADLVDAKTYRSPKITRQDNKIIVQNSNEQNENINLFIYSKDEVVYSYSESFDGNYEKVFNLEKLAAGDYRVIVRNDQLSEEISIAIK